MDDPIRITDPSSGATPELMALLSGAEAPSPIGADAFERGLSHALRLAAAPAAAAGTWLTLKTAAWALTGSAAVAAAVVIATPAPEPAPAPPAPALAPATDRPKAVATPRAEPEPYVEAVDTVAPAPAPVARTERTPRVRAEEALAREAKLLEQARAALETRPSDALDLLGEHRRAFPRGQLGAEHEMIAVEALVRLDRHEEARRRAARALSRYPGGLYAERMRRVLER